MSTGPRQPGAVQYFHMARECVTLITKLRYYLCEMQAQLAQPAAPKPGFCQLFQLQVPLNVLLCVSERVTLWGATLENSDFFREDLMGSDEDYQLRYIDNEEYPKSKVLDPRQLSGSLLSSELFAYQSVRALEVLTALQVHLAHFQVLHNHLAEQGNHIYEVPGKDKNA